MSTLLLVPAPASRANGQWGRHIGSTDMHITTTIDAAALREKQWTEARGEVGGRPAAPGEGAAAA